MWRGGREAGRKETVPARVRTARRVLVGGALLAGPVLPRLTPQLAAGFMLQTATGASAKARPGCNLHVHAPHLLPDALLHCPDRCGAIEAGRGQVGPTG